MRSLFSSGFVKGVSTGYLLMLFNNLIGLWLIPYSLKYLTREEFSLFYIATDVILWLGIVNLGTSSVFITRVSQVLGKGGEVGKEILALVNTGFFVQCFFAFSIFILGILTSFFLPSFFSAGQYTTEFQLTFFILSLSAGITLVGQVFSGLLVASKQIHIDNLIQIILIVPRIALTVLLLHLGYGIVALALVNLFVSVLGLAIPYFRVRRRLTEFKIRLNYFDRKLLKDFIHNGVWFSIGGIAGILILNMDRFVIGNFIGLALVTNFIITQKLYDIASKVVSQVVNVTRPYFAGLFGRRDLNSMKSAYSAIFIFTLVISSFLATLILIINKYFISVWVGESFYAGDEISLFMALNFILQTSILPNRVMGATTLYKIRLHSLIRLGDGITNLLISIALAKTLGILGVVMASVITTIIFSNVVLTNLTQRFFKENETIINKRINIFYLLVGLPVVFFMLNQLPLWSSFSLFLIVSGVILMLLFFMRDRISSFAFIKKIFFK